MTLTLGSAILAVLAIFFTIALVRCLIPLIISIFFFIVGIFADETGTVAAVGVVGAVLNGIGAIVFGLLDWWVISALQKYFH